MRLRSEDGITRPSLKGDAQLFEFASIGMAVATNEGRLLVVNPQLCSQLARAAGDLAASSLEDITHPDDWSNLAKALRDFAAGSSEPFTQRQRCLAADGAVIWVDLTVTPTSGSASLSPQLLAQFIDVTAEVENLQTLHASARHFQVLSENSTDVVAQTDTQGLITWVSPSVTTLLGWESALLAGRSISVFVAKPDREAFTAALLGIRTGQDMRNEIIRFRTTSGAYRVMSVTARSLTVEGGLMTGMAFGLRDVTEELRAKRELARSEEQFRLAMQGAPQGMAVTDSEDRIVQVNPALSELMNTPDRLLIGHKFREFIPEDERAAFEDLRSRLLLGELDSIRTEHRLLGSELELWVDHAVGMLRNESGSARLFVHQFADRTETRRMQADLTYRATHDEHTGLSNRAGLRTRLEQRLGLKHDSAKHIGVLWCDIDGLKQINDSFGHAVGDAAIASVAERLAGAVRHHDIVGRLGGDEFVIVLDQCPDETTLMTVAGNLQKAASRPIRTAAGLKVKVTVSMGAVLAASASDTDQVLSRADHAMYRAKRTGRNRVALEAAEVGQQED